MGTYYRKLQRRRAETVGSFLVREDHAYDEMKKALDKLVDQQLGTKKETTAASWRTPRKTTERNPESPERRGSTPARELHEDVEVYDDDEDDDYGVETQEDERHEVTMDIMRGWMILEMMMFTDQEKNAVKSSTGNKMDYQSVVRALKDQWDDAAIQRHDRAIHGSVNYTDVTEDCAYD